MKSAIAVSVLVVALGWGTAVVSAQDGEAIVKDRRGDDEGDERGDKWYQEIP